MHKPVALNDGVSSIDPAEIAYYDRFSELWWDTQGPFWPLHRLNELRTKFLVNEMCQRFERSPSDLKPLRGLRVLDVGCGGGILTESIARYGAHVHGVDVTERNIVVARQHAQQQGLTIDYRLITAEAMAKNDVQYDVVCNMEVVEHVADLPGFMHACNQLVAPNGMTFIATINRTILSWLFAIVGAEYVLKWLPRGTHQWRRFPTPGELERLLTRDGLFIEKRRGVRVNPLTRHFTITKFLGVNYMLVCRKSNA